MAEPLFDRQDGGGGFPVELSRQLEGKPASEHPAIISTFYTGRETQLRQAAQRAIAQAGAGAPGGTPSPTPTVITTKPQLTKEAFWQDPQKAVTDLTAGLLTQEQFV